LAFPAEMGYTLVVSLNAKPLHNRKEAQNMMRYIDTVRQCMRALHRTGAVVALCAATLTLHAQLNEAWIVGYSGWIDNRYNIYMTVDSDGNVYVTGTFNFLVPNTYYGVLVTLKYDANGFLRFAQADTLYAGYARDIAVDSRGNVYVLAGDIYWYYTHVIKYDANGGRRWVRIVTSPQSFPVALEVDSAGNVYVLATTRSSNDYLTLKYDTNGVLLWSQQYNGGGTEIAVDLALDSAGNVIVTGTGNNDYLTVKYNANGGLLWFRRYDGGGTETAADLTVDSAGNIIVTGTSNDDYLTLRYDANGNLLWARRFNVGTDRATAVTVDSAGNVYVTGESNGSFATVSYQPNGTQRWVRTSNGGLSQCRPVAVAVDNAGNVYVAGTGTVGSGDTSYLTVKYDANGNEAAQLYDSTLGIERLTAGVLDRAMNFIVTGFSVDPYSGGYGAEIVTIKYATGAPISNEGDVNGDGCVDDADLLIVLFNFGRGCN